MRRDELGNPVPVEGVGPAVSNSFVVSHLGEGISHHHGGLVIIMVDGTSGDILQKGTSS